MRAIKGHTFGWWPGIDKRIVFKPKPPDNQNSLKMRLKRIKKLSDIGEYDYDYQAEEDNYRWH